MQAYWITFEERATEPAEETDCQGCGAPRYGACAYCGRGESALR